MTPKQESLARADLEAKASVLIFAAIAIIDKSLIASFRAFGVLTVDYFDRESAAGKIKESRALGWAFVRDNAIDEESGNLVYSDNDIDKYAEEAVTLIIARSILIAEKAQAAYADETINKEQVIKNTLNARRKGRIEGYATDAAHGAVEIAKFSLVGFLFSQQSAGDEVSAFTKQWMALVDGVTRETHLIANGQTVAVNEYFIVGGFPMLYPRDRRAPIEETANCRCLSNYGITWSK